MEQTHKLFTLQEVADMLRVSPQAVRRRMREGILGFIKNGKRILCTKEQVDDYLDRVTENRKAA